MLHHVKLPYSCEGVKKWRNWFLVEKTYQMTAAVWWGYAWGTLLPSPVVSAHEVGNCINIVTYCVIISVGLLSAGRANLSVETAFQGTALLWPRKYFASDMYLYRCEFLFLFFSFLFFLFVHLFSISEGLQFFGHCSRSYSKVVCVKVFLFVHTLCIQCAFLYGDWILLRSARLY